MKIQQQRPAPSFAFLVTAGIFCVLSVAIFFRQFLASRSDLIAGDIGDDRFIIAMLEHWRAVFQGKANFLSPNFYWPEKGMLGYSEALFLFSLPYAAARAAGLDIYLSFEFALVCFKIIGFASMLWLLRTFVRISRPAAIVGAFLFTLSNLYFVSLGHAQLMAVTLVPLLLGCLCSAWASGRERRTAVQLFAAGSSGVLLGLILFTSFYIGWLTIFVGTLTLVTALLLQVCQARTLDPVKYWLGAVRDRTLMIGTACVAFALCMVPFFLTYLPTLKSTGGRSFSEILLYSAHPIDLINVGPLNYMWGSALSHVTESISHHPMAPGESQMGWPPVTLAILAGGVLSHLAWTGHSRRPNDNKSRFLIFLMTLSLMIGLLLSVDISGHSLWRIVFHLPGASAIRAPARLNLVLNLLVVIAVCLVLDLVAQFGRGPFWCVTLLLISEQINTMPAHAISRQQENAILRKPEVQALGCTSFFLSAPADPTRPFFANQIDAMLIARLENIPTMNGYSGWNPPGWDLTNFDPNYQTNVKRWAKVNHISSGICGLNLSDGSWKQADMGTPKYQSGTRLGFEPDGNARMYEAEGWSTAESGITWLVGPHSTLELPLLERPRSDLLLSFKAAAFIAPRHPHFQEFLRVNGTDVAQWSISSPFVEKSIRLPSRLLSSSPLRIEFATADPKSPADFGLSPDARKLSLALEEMKLTPVAAGTTYSLGSVLDFTWGGNSLPYEVGGWSGAEEGGTWTINSNSKLRLLLANQPSADLSLSIRAHAFVTPLHPKLKEDLFVNKEAIVSWIVTKPTLEKRILIPRKALRSRVLEIEFGNRDAKSPAELELSTDPRKISLAIESLRIDAAGAEVVASHQ